MALLFRASRCLRARAQILRSGRTLSHVASPAVLSAVARGEPVVALETAIVTHGLPFPTNVEVALAAEQAVRDAGATPATVGVIGGRPVVGLSEAEIRQLGDPSASIKPMKAGRRELPYAAHFGLSAGTTVSATMHLAHAAGLRVFATGGIGGVTPGVEDDVSEDLTALGDTAVAVISAGIKSILDVPRTLERLETLGVPVATLLDDNESPGTPVAFPTFYSRSGPPSPLSIPRNEAAAYLHSHFALLRSGVLLANPIPKENEADGQLIARAIEEARKLAAQRGIIGKAWTPFVLDHVRLATGGKSVESNIALYLNNARTAAYIAVGYAAHTPARHPSDLLPIDAADGFPLSAPSSEENPLPESEPSISIPTTQSFTPPSPGGPRTKPIVIGGTVLDITSHILPTDSYLGTSSPGYVRQNSGGVARNIVEACWRVGIEPVFGSVLGDDPQGRALMTRMRALGLPIEDIATVSNPTAVYSCLLNPSGDLIAAVADMRALDALSGDRVASWLDKHLGAETPVVAVDGNVSIEGLRVLLARCSAAGVKVVFEPTSVVKSTRILDAMFGPGGANGAPEIVTPNVDELGAMYRYGHKMGWLKGVEEVVGDEGRQEREKVLEKVDVLRGGVEPGRASKDQGILTWHANPQKTLCFWTSSFHFLL